MSALADGIHQLSWADYKALPRVNNSSLKVLGQKSPAHYRHQLLNPENDDTDERRLGRATHAAALEPERFRRDFIAYAERRNSNAWKAFNEKHTAAGREILTQGGWDEAVRISEKVRSNALAQPFLSGGRAEHAVLWTHREPAVGGLPAFEEPMKCRIDFLCNSKAIADLKTTRDASPAGFGREAHRYGYIVQAAVNVDAVFAVTGERWPFFIIAVESKAPYAVGVYKVTDEQLEMGRETYRGWLQLLNMCRRDNHWPAYATTSMDLALPAYAMPDPEDELDDLGLVFPESTTETH